MGFGTRAGYVVPVRRSRRPWRDLGFALLLLLPVVVTAVVASWLAPHDPFAIVGKALSPPSGDFPLGTDDLGRDLLSALIFGSRTALFIIATVGSAVLLIGTIVGAVSGYVGGWIDDALMRLTEAVQVLPRFFLALVILALFGPGLDRLALVLAFTSWPMVARVIRAEVLTLRTAAFVEAARCMGATPLRILHREVLPLAVPPAIPLILLVAGQAVLIEASLGFLGLGDPSVVSWGVLAANAQPFLRRAWWLALFPGLAIVITVVGTDLLGAWFGAGARRGDVDRPGRGQRRDGARRVPRVATRRG